MWSLREGGREDNTSFRLSELGEGRCHSLKEEEIWAKGRRGQLRLSFNGVEIYVIFRRGSKVRWIGPEALTDVKSRNSGFGYQERVDGLYSPENGGDPLCPYGQIP